MVINKIIIRKLTKLASLGILILMSFSFVKYITKDSIRKFKITKHWPIRLKDRNAYFDYVSYNYVITYKDYVLYEFPQDGELNDTLPNPNTYFQLGVFKETDGFGYYTDSKKLIVNKIIVVDTLLGDHGYPLKPIIVFNNYKLVSEQKICDGKKYNLIRKYITLNKKDISYADTVKVYFSNKGVKLPIPLFEKEFILENKLDIAKFEFIYNPRRYNNDTLLYPKSTFSMSIDEVKITDYYSYLSFFKKLK